MSTDKAWQKWGKVDPYFGVLTDDMFRGGGDEVRDEFFARGAHVIETELEVLGRTFGFVPGGRALDFGSGVGRLGIPLAERFDQVVGVDISPNMNAEAEKNCLKRSINNASFVLSDDTLSQASGTFNFVHSFIVLQHIATDRGESVIRSMLEKLAPGGAAMIHVSVRRRQTALRRLGYKLRHTVPGVHPLLNLAGGRPVGDPPIRMSEYDLPRLIDIFKNSGLDSVLVVPEDHGACLTTRIYGRKNP